MAQPIEIFRPIGATVTLAAATSSGSVAITKIGFANEDEQVRIANTGSVIVYIALGDSGVTAAVASGIPILPNTAEMFHITTAQTHLAGITASGSATLYITAGYGV